MLSGPSGTVILPPFVGQLLNVALDVSRCLWNPKLIRLRLPVLILAGMPISPRTSGGATFVDEQQKNGDPCHDLPADGR
jgi:hypothetical protein